MRSRISAAATLAVTLAATTSAQAFEVKHAQGGELVRWRRPNVAWTVDRSVRDVPGAEDAIKAASGAWTKRGGAPVLTVAAASAAEAVLEPGFDGTSAIFYAKDGFAPAGAALAVTLLSFDDRTGEVLEADIVLNGKYQIGVVGAAAAKPTSASAPGAETYDVRRIVAHEMGHALGLSDEPARKDALMYLYIARAQALPAKPASDDLAGIAALYGAGAAQGASAGSSASADHAGCTGAVVARSGPRSAPGAAYCAVGLVMAALVMARSRRRGGRSGAACAVLAALVMVMPVYEEDANADANASADASANADANADADADATADAVVTGVETTAIRGVFRSDVLTDCVSECPIGSRVMVWGGTLGGVRQVIGGAHVPAVGERVRIVRSRDGSVRVTTRLAE